MFLPIWFCLLSAAVVVGAGALVGMLLGWVIGLRSPGYDGQPMLDAVIGGMALLAINVAINVADSHMTSLNGHVLGPRGILLNHKLLWAALTMALTVGGRHQFASRAARRDGIRSFEQGGIASESPRH